MCQKSRQVKVFAAALTIALSLFLLLRGFAAAAQPSIDAAEIEKETVAADMFVCWWKTDKSSIRIGEEFTLLLTCRSAESDRERVVLNESHFDSNILALSPYQVKKGRRYKDIVRVLPGPEGPVTFRSLQYAYTVNLMGEGFFGKDVPLPSLAIRYHIDLIHKDTVTPGKERTYLLPALPMKIQSLVPKAANNIRDGGLGRFGEIEDRRRQAIVAFIAAGILLLLPLLVIFPPLMRSVRGRRANVPNGTVFHEKDLLKRLTKALYRIQKGRRTLSWDDLSIATAVSVFRVGASMAIGHRIVQTPVSSETLPREGQLAFRKGLPFRTKVLVSASLTPEGMAEFLSGTLRFSAVRERRKQLLGESQAAFSLFNQVRYASPDKIPQEEALDEALKVGFRLLRELRRDRNPVVRMWRRIANLFLWWRRHWKRS